jgi:hypothetical protein
MLPFRRHWPDSHLDSAPLNVDTVRQAVALALAPGHFFLAPKGQLRLEHLASHTRRWEVFRGRLLDPAHTREERTFEEWHLYLDGDPGPVLSLLFDPGRGELHVVRGLLCHVWETYDSEGSILTREATRWTAELTGTIDLGELADPAELLDELTARLFHAVVGASRLPLTSVEAPLPLFSFGRLGYFHVPGGVGEPARSWRELLERTADVPLTASEQAKRLETLLHATPADEVSELALALPDGVLGVLTTTFNEVSLSPWTGLVDRALSLLDELGRQGRITDAGLADFLGGLLRQVCRHLTAYDLVVFHHRGANYPDALLLDAVLKRLLRLTEEAPALFAGDAGRLRRRALRQTWLLRRTYEGHPVPEVPTSPGESGRVIAGHPRVPEEVILNPGQRRRRLYDGDPLPPHLGPHGREILRQSGDDLRDSAELRELGVALFLDRPLGVAKQPGEPDQTVLLSHVAFSRSIALGRLQRLADDPEVAVPPEVNSLLETLEVRGVPVAEVASQSRPGSVSIADARQAADDFVLVRTTTGSARALFAQYGLETVADARDVLLLPEANALLFRRPSTGEVIGRLRLNLDGGYLSRGGREYLRDGVEFIPAL